MEEVRGEGERKREEKGGGKEGEKRGRERGREMNENKFVCVGSAVNPSL